MKTLKVLREEIDDCRDEIKAIVAKADGEQRELTQSEAARVDQLADEILPDLQARADRASKLESQKLAAAAGRMERILAGQNGDDGERLQPTMRDSHGRPIYCLSREQKVASTLDTPAVENGFGETLRALVCGANQFTPDRVKAALTSNNGLAGGFLVPSEFSTIIVDKARALSVIMQAGAMTVPMSTSSLTIATVATDPTFQLKAENAAFDEASVEFGAVELTSATIGCIISASRELAEDAPNFAQVIEGVMARALAVELDRQAIQGTASQELMGLVTNPNIAETDSIGAIAYEDLAAAAAAVRLLNHEPSSVILNVQAAEDLKVLTSGDGTNSAKNWLGAPPSLDGVAMLPTTGCPLANAIIGDFTKAVWGIRQQATVEVSGEAGEAFQRNQIKFRIVFRGSFGIVDESAFHRLAGITS